MKQSYDLNYQEPIDVSAELTAYLSKIDQLEKAYALLRSIKATAETAVNNGKLPVLTVGQYDALMNLEEV